MANEQGNNLKHIDGMELQSTEPEHQLVAGTIDLTRTANVNVIGTTNTANNHEIDNESTESKQQPATNITQSTLTLGHLGLLEENLGHGIDYWLKEEKTDGGVCFYRE